jgi:hypothetical protein
MWPDLRPFRGAVRRTNGQRLFRVPKGGQREAAMTGYPGVGHGSEPDRRGKSRRRQGHAGTSLVISGLDHVVVLIEDIVADTQAYGRDSGKHVLPSPSN